MSPRLRSLLVLLVGVTALAFVADVVVRTPGFLVPRDFLEYWAAGRVNLRGGNPYHPDELLAEQKLADPSRTEAVMMWNPPPALAVYLPLGAISSRWATLLWIGLQLAAVLVACDLLWRMYSQCGPLAERAVASQVKSELGRLESSTSRVAPLAERVDHTESHRWLAAVFAMIFVGTWWLVAYGQNTGFLLLGLAGFLHFRRKDKPLVAGVFAALTALKPHLLACFGMLLVVDAVSRRGAKSLAAGVAVIGIALGVAVVANPAVITQFVDAVRHPAEGATALSDWTLPVPAYWLRKWLAPSHFWVQFVPCVLACAAFLVYRILKGGEWDWARMLPVVVAVSILTTPYGGWIFDLPVLLVPVVWAAARLVSTCQYFLTGVFVLGQVAITVASFTWAGALHAYSWVAPAVLALCLLARARRS